MIKRRTTVKDPSGDAAYYQPTLAEIEVSEDEKLPVMKTRSDEDKKEQAISVPEKDKEIWKLNKRSEELEKASVHPPVAAHIYEKYGKDLEDTKSQEQNYARKAAILAEELKQEKLRHTETMKKLQETEQKLQNELNRKDNERIQQLKKSEDFAQVELAATIADKKIMLIEQTKESSIAVDDDRKHESAKSQDRWDKVKKIQSYIDELEASKAELIRQCEEAKDLLKQCSASNIPELFRGPELKMNYRDDASAKSDGVVELDLALKIAKCHEIFICPLEIGSEQLTDHLATEGYIIARICKIPGKTVHSDLPVDDLVRHQTYIPPHRRVTVKPEPPFWKMNMFGKLTIGGITECVFRLHRLGLCLNGNFSLKSFCYTTSKKIKLSAEVKSSACHRTMDGMDLDYFALHDTIKQILSLCQHGTPFDLKCLLDLLSSQDPSEKQIIIRYNASLMDEIQKRNHFLIMYGRFNQIKDEDGVTSERIQKVLKFINPEPGWQTRLYENEFTAMVSLRHVVDSGRALEGKLDLLETWRHNFTHLHEKSVAMNDEESFALNDEDEVDIMDSVSKGVINQLQEGMHSIQELELPHLMHTMKK